MPISGAGQPRRFRRILLITFAWFASGIALSMLVSWGIVIANPKTQTAATVQSVGDRDELVSARVSSGFGSMHIDLTRELAQSWSPMRAAGPPDTPAMGDDAAAWASLTQDAQKEWLELAYDRAVVPKEVQVYETLAPGAVSRVSAYDERGNATEAWSGNDPAAPNQSGIYIAKIPLRGSRPTDRIRIDIDSPRVSGWNEIDAVGLVGQDGSLQWASSVRASSTYATGAGRSGPIYSPALFRDALPAWADPDELLSSSAKANDARTIEAHGWPLLAFYGNDPPALQNASSISITKSPSVTITAPARIWPFHPIWLGITANGFFYGGVLALLYISTFGLRRDLRESSRLRRGCCIRCGYDLRYDFVRGCSECGWNRESVAQ
jgi:hypothetical protein